MAKVLVADVPQMHDRIRECLSGHELVFATSLTQAVMALRHDGYSLIVIGLHFDESRMFELLTYIRSLDTYKDAEVICVQGLDQMMPEAVMHTVDMAVKALGGTAFVDLRDQSHYFRTHCDFLDRVASEGSPLRPN
jgi:PleD family two-component response regulator